MSVQIFYTDISTIKENTPNTSCGLAYTCGGKKKKCCKKYKKKGKSHCKKCPVQA